MRVIGLMPGTSYDAIDAAAELSLVDDSVVLKPLGMVSEPDGDELREELTAALPPATTTPAELCRLDTLIGRALAAAAGPATRS
jgi:anhydro-N-acetylmuramic acid kinase